MSLAVIDVAVAEPYQAFVGPGALSHLAHVCGPFSALAVLADERALELHGAKLDGLHRDAPRVALPRGEAAKSWPVLERALEALAAARLDRRSAVVTFGGGAATDLGGLAASLYMRGIAVIHCPTTLLAQVDAAVGGKTAVNLGAGKNLAGTFHQPRAVLCDTEVLGTLDASELRSGLGEVVKAAVLGAPGLLAALERDAARLVAADPSALAAATEASVRLKAGVVAGDERESGPRKSLNLGHTFAHAIEHAAGYGRIPHGVAVAVGIALACEAARATGRLEEPDLPRRVRSLLGALGLPASLRELRLASGAALAPADLARAMELDKKNEQGALTLVLPRAVGRVDVDVRPPPDLLALLLDAA